MPRLSAACTCVRLKLDNRLENAHSQTDALTVCQDRGVPIDLLALCITGSPIGAVKS